MHSTPDQAFTTHNYTHVDRAFEEAAQRNSSYTRHVSRQSLISGAIAGGISLIALGLFIVMACWGYSLLQKKPAPIFIEKPTYVPIPPAQALPSTKEIAKSRIKHLQEKETQENSNSSEAKPIAVYDYTIFKTIPFSSGKVKGITVGMRYAKHTDTKPSKQWCYVEKPNSNGVVSTVYIAEKRGETLSDIKLTSSMASELGITMRQLRKAQRLCSFD